MSDLSKLTRALIADGQKPVMATASPLRDAFFASASEVLKNGAPGLRQVARDALARSIAARCERAVEIAQRSERAA